ncbi:hypothetical protein ACFWFS_00280 [Streptomyces albidoflavus]
MLVSYRHEDGTVESVSTDDLSALESAEVENVTGETWDGVESALRAESPTAMRAVLWVHRKRSAAGLRFNEFDLPSWRRRLTARLELADLEEMVSNLRRSGEAGGSGWDEVLEHLRSLADDPEDVDRAVAATSPKAAAPAKKPAASKS